MQIDRYNHLQFPRDSGVAPNGRDATSAGAPGTGAGKTPSGVALPGAAAALARPDSVVLKVQLPGSLSDNPDRMQAGFYSDGRNFAARSNGEDNASIQAAEHQRALDRNAGVFTRITLNKEGVLVAQKSQPQPSGEARQPDFVALAVSAMREFSDEAERQKVQSFDFNAAQDEAPVSKFKGLQQLAARFNVFA